MWRDRSDTFGILCWRKEKKEKEKKKNEKEKKKKEKKYIQDEGYNIIYNIIYYII